MVCCPSEEGTVVTNGMSEYARDGENANSALLVGIEPAQFPSEHPLAGMYYQFCNLRDVLPERVTETMCEALLKMDKMLAGFANSEAVLTGPETRSSSPVRIVRDEFFQTAANGVFPCGEGAGYAGGIISAAVDGIKCAEAVLRDEH